MRLKRPSRKDALAVTFTLILIGMLMAHAVRVAVRGGTW